MYDYISSGEKQPLHIYEEKKTYIMWLLFSQICLSGHFDSPRSFLFRLNSLSTPLFFLLLFLQPKL